MLGATILGSFILTMAVLAWVKRAREADLADLIAALPHPRPFVARLSGGFPYAPCERKTSSEDEIPKLVCANAPATPEQQARLTGLRSGFFRYARRQPKARQRHLSALWTLATEGTRGNLDRTIEDLEAAAKLEPENGAILSDLAAAFTARAADTDDARDLVRALDAAERAAQASPEVAEALWNRAVAREAFVRLPALTAWRELLATARGLDWQEEAGAAISRLDQPTMRERWDREMPRLSAALEQKERNRSLKIVSTFPNEARSWVETDLLPRWGATVERGDLARATKILAQASAVCEHLADVTGDTLFLRGVRVAEEAQRRGPGNRVLVALARAHRQWGEGLAAFDRAEYEAATTAFLAAQSGLSKAPSPLADWVQYLVLRCAYRVGDYTPVLEQTEQLLSRVEELELPALVGRLAWVRGSTHAAIGQASDAARWYDHALRNFEKASDSLLRAALHVRSASAQADLGELPVAWQHRLLALRGFYSREDAAEFPTAVAESLFGARELGELHAALVLQDEEISRARAQSTPLALLLALRHRADLLSELDPSEAELAIATARRDAGQLPSDRQRHFVLHQINFVHAQLLRKSDPERCVELLTGVEAGFRETAPSVLPQVLYEQAVCYRAQGAIAAAETGLRAALAEVETLFRMRGTPQERAALVAGLKPIYNEMIAVQLEMGDKAEALLFADRARSRALLEWLARLPTAEERKQLLTASPPLPEHVADLQSSLPLSGPFIEYYLDAEELLAWVVRPGSLDLIRTPADRAAVAGLVESLGGERADAHPRSATALALLFDLLIRPLSPYLEPGETIHLITDGALQAVPFAALLDRKTERFLIEDYPLVHVPSLTSYRRGREARKADPPDWSSALIVANPSFDRARFPHFQPLSGADREGGSLLQILPTSQLLCGEKATAKAVLAALGQHTLVHMAAHGIASHSNPLYSYLVLASDASGADAGKVYASDLLSTELPNTRLVVLAACHSAGGSSNEGVAGLVWPLLARGVPQVVAAVGPLGDLASATFFRDFYESLRESRSPVLALRAAQLRAIRQGSGPGMPAWANVRLYGND